MHCSELHNHCSRATQCLIVIHQRQKGKRRDTVPYCIMVWFEFKHEHYRHRLEDESHHHPLPDLWLQFQILTKHSHLSQPLISILRTDIWIEIDVNKHNPTIHDRQGHNPPTEESKGFSFILNNNLNMLENQVVGSPKGRNNRNTKISDRISDRMSGQDSLCWRFLHI